MKSLLSALPWAMDGSHLQPLHAGPGRERRPLTGPGQPFCGLVTLATTIKVPFPVWTTVPVCYVAPSSVTSGTCRKPEPLLTEQLYAGPISHLGHPHSNSQPCLAHPACAAGPGRRGAKALAALGVSAVGAWVGARSLKWEEGIFGTGLKGRLPRT